MFGELHNAIIHIPIGLLVGYSLLEIGCFFFPSYRKKLNLGKYIILILGLGGGMLALQTGEALEELHGENKLIELHSTFATATIIIYTIIATSLTLIYFSSQKQVNNFFKKNNKLNKLWQILLLIAQYITQKTILLLLSVFGIILLVITGALGGSIAHGQNADIITSFIYALFF